MKRLFSSLRTRLALLIIMAMLPVLGLTIYTDIEERAFIVADMEEGVQRLAQLAAGTQEQLIEGTRQLLTALSKLPSVQNGNGKLCDEHFADLLKDYPQYANIGAVSARGDLFCSAVQANRRVNLSSEEWFQETVKSLDFTISGFHKSYSTGKPTLQFSYPVIDDDGNLRGALFAALDLNQLNQLISEVQLPDGAEFIMVAKNGTVLAALPDSERWVGKTLSHTQIVKAILTQGEDVEELPGLDGETRLYTFTPLRSTVETGLYISIGIPLSIAFAEPNKVMYDHLVTLGVVSLLALLAVWFGGDRFILRRIKALVSASQRLAAGDMKSRTGLPPGTGELDLLARTFDEMAEALEERAIRLRQAEAKYRTLVEQMPAIVYTAVLDESRSTLYISPQVEKVLGFSAAEWHSDPELWIRQIDAEDRTRVREVYERCHIDGSAFSCEYRIRARHGQVLWFCDEALVVWDELNSRHYLQGIMRDTTEYKRAEEKLLAYQVQLRSLASQLSLAEERERRRIATELHDSVGQSLAISKIKLGALKQSARSSDHKASVDEVRNLIEQAIQDTRSLIFKISSPILYELGFEAAMEWLTEQVQKKHGIVSRFEDDREPKPLDEDIRVLLFQAANELLVNVAKHAGARTVSVSLRRTNGFIEIGVADDGVGFDASRIGARWGRADGFGLFSIRERLNHVDGRIEIVSLPEQGTRVTMLAPLMRADTHSV